MWVKVPWVKGCGWWTPGDKCVKEARDSTWLGMCGSVVEVRYGVVGMGSGVWARERGDVLMRDWGFAGGTVGCQLPGRAARSKRSD